MKIERRKVKTESKINASAQERAELAKVLRRILERPDVTGDVVISLGQGGVSAVALVEVSKAE